MIDYFKGTLHVNVQDDVSVIDFRISGTRSGDTQID